MCTGMGLQILEASGAFLQRQVISGHESLAVVADSVARDVDSARVFVRGMGRNASTTISVAADTFDTLKSEIGDAICAEYAPSEAEIAAEVRERLRAVALPSSLDDATQKFERLVGVGRAGPLASLGPPTVDARGKLSGAVGALKHLSQMIFYAFASAVPYAGVASRDELYELIAWQHWFRAVADVNAEKATANAKLLLEVLRALNAPTGDDDEEGAGRGATTPATGGGSGGDDASTTVFFGHDGNLDGLASLLGIEWEAPPYVGGASLLPTPPGSGLLFEADASTGLLDVSFVYPLYATDDEPPALNRSGVLERSVVLRGLSFCRSCRSASTQPVRN